MKDKLVFIRLALIPLFIFSITYSKGIDYHNHIFSKITFSLFLGLTILNIFQEKRGFEFIEALSNKVLIWFTFPLLFIKMGFPKWIAYIVLFREALMVIGWFIFYNTFPEGVFGRERGIFGKGVFLFQIITILLYLLYGMNQYTYLIAIVMLTFTITSLLDYLINV